MPLIYNKALNLTEREVRYAMANTKSNEGAARFIGCSPTTYKKYAKQYIDEETGLSLYELHKNQSGRGISKVTHSDTQFKTTDIFEVLEGKHPTYNPKRLEERIRRELIFPEECGMCGFSEKRLLDYKVPLILVWKDGNIRNHHKDNLQFLCYNCYFLTYDDLILPKKILKFK